MSAADVDDDGVLNGLLDGLSALSLQFVPGSPAPPPPRPFDCDHDPTVDSLSCTEYPDC